MTIHYAKRDQPIIGGCELVDGDRTYARWGAVDLAGTQVDCERCLSFRPRVEDDKFVEMIQRNIRALEERAVDNPVILAQVIMLAQRLSEITNVVIAQSATRYSINPMSAPSMKELARMLKMEPSSASQRRKLGDRVLFERSMGQETMTQRDRAAQTRAANHADESLASWLERRESV